MTWIETVQAKVAAYKDQRAAVLRAGLGLVLLAAGLHKLAVPFVWTPYMAPWASNILASFGVSSSLFLQVNAVGEVVIGAALLLDIYTVVAVGLAALGFVAILLNLASMGTMYIDIIVRDIGLLALAVGVMLQAAPDDD